MNLTELFNRDVTQLTFDEIEELLNEGFEPVTCRGCDSPACPGWHWQDCNPVRGEGDSLRYRHGVESQFNVGGGVKHLCIV
jgi:hypothetical protein